ncbi:hypothetical protein HZC53_04915 [Candidatus Uhrbacteria bacterium]|nr:hypothetical protein [Candidatus Uhrbacteria bacterium]
MFTRILIGLILVAVGFVIVWKTRKFIETFGPIAWADAKLGGGGTSLMYKTIGIILIFVGFMYATNLWTAFLEATIGAALFPKAPTE